MTVQTVKKGISGTQTTGIDISRFKQKLPERPKVTDGPIAYRIYKSRARLVVRFYISRGWRAKKSGRWFVYDSDTGRVATRTSRHGYDKIEATRIAREYRDTYGAYAKAPF